MPRSKKPVSAIQLAANRANAARSTGPRTPEGQARSAQNSRKHGFAAAEFAVVRLEDLQAVAHLKADLGRIALTQQALIRAARLETGLFVTRAQNRNYALAEGFHRMVRQSNCWSLFLRYQAQTERHCRRAVEEFERLKALRSELPNEPIFEPQPEQNQTTSTPFETNPIPPEKAEPAPPPEVRA